MSYKSYSKEYRDSIVKLARTGTPVAQLAREYDPSAATIHKWLRAEQESVRRVESARPGESSDEERRRLARENRDLREEVAILKKAAAWFALDVVKIGARSSRS